MPWSLEQVGGHPVDCYDPSTPGKPHFGLIFLHGVGQETLRGESPFTDVLDELNLPCVSPITKLSWWTDKPYPEFDPQLTAEMHLVTNVIPYVTKRWGIQPSAIGLFGISMGGQGALRLGFKRPGLFPVVAGISSAIDYHEYYGQGLSLDQMYESKEQCRQDTVPMHVHPNEYPPSIFFCVDPTDGPWLRGNDRLHEKLNALGIQHDCDLLTRAGGHTWDYFNSMALRTIRFLHEGLVAQSRRLL